MADREDYVFSARLAEQADRFEDMRDKVKLIVNMGVGLNVEERNLLSVAYKNIVGQRRTAWRVLSNLEANQAKDKPEMGAVCQAFRQQIETELNDICFDMINLLNDQLIDESNTGSDVDSLVFYKKMLGDYYRYITEFQVSPKREEYSECSLKAYKAASDDARSKLAKTHPIRLGLALNFSVFYYEILNSPDHACQLARAAFDDAIAELDQLKEESYKDSTLIMQLIRDNLTLWTSEIKDTQNDGTNVENIEQEN